MSVNLYSSLRVVGIRTVRSAAVHSSRIAASLLPCTVVYEQRSLARLMQPVMTHIFPATEGELIAKAQHKALVRVRVPEGAYEECGADLSASAYAANVCATHLSSAAVAAATGPRCAAERACTASARTRWCFRATRRQLAEAGCGNCLPPGDHTGSRSRPSPTLQKHLCDSTRGFPLQNRAHCSKAVGMGTCSLPACPALVPPYPADCFQWLSCPTRLRSPTLGGKSKGYLQK